MHNDISRWTFEAARGYRAVLLQQGRVLLDAESNEQAAITAHHDEVRARDVVGRHGGPLDGAGWAVVDTTGAAPAGTPWPDLRLTPGRYYVDGVVVEGDHGAPPDGWPLADQPFLRAVGDLPGLPEPEADGRYAVLLDVFTHHVTADEAPELLESSLGGPDTATRARTAWQVRLSPVDSGTTCVDMAEPGIGARTHATMTASLQPADPSDDPCRLTTAGGYQLLENQLYRVQIHQVDDAGHATYLWSRENGSVVAQLLEIGPPTAATHDAVLTLDREGRDDELSVTDGSLVEVTSVERQLAGLPGYLATAVGPSATTVPVTWGAGGGPPSLADLGETRVVRRWEGGPATANSAWDPLEGGIRVRFDPDAGDFHVGDYWLVPARAVRLVYGVSALAGTIEWPTDSTGQPAARAPIGVEHHVAAVGLLDRSSPAGGPVWTLVSDCRPLFPALTDLVSLDLLGGDGQASRPGAAFPEIVRVVVRNGGIAVPGARVRFTTPGHLRAPGADPTTADPHELEVVTDAEGYADVRWRLADGAPDTQALTAVRVDGGGDPVGAEARVTGHRLPPGGACVVIRPDMDVAAVFAELSGGASVSICFTAGEWDLREPAVLREVSEVRVSGAAGATRLRAAGESVLRFEDCADVVVTDLHLESTPREEGESLAGSLTVLRVVRAHVDRVSARVGGAPVRWASGINVSGRPPGREGVPSAQVKVHDCRVLVGEQQVGVLVADARRADVVGTGVEVWRPEGLVGDDTFFEWLRFPKFARLVAQRAIAPLPRGSDDLGPRTGFAQIVAGGREEDPFGTEIVTSRGAPDLEGWKAYIAENGLGGEGVDVIQTRVRDDLMHQDRSSRFFNERTLFATWLRKVQKELLASPAAADGIVVAGAGASDVRVVDCSVTGALRGIVAALSDSDRAPETIDRVQLRGNTVAPAQLAALGFTEQGMYVGNCESLVVAANHVGSGERLGYAVDGLLCAGRLGAHAVVSGNTFDGVAVGVRVRPGPSTPSGPTLRIARDNVSTAGPVLVDGTGVWRSVDNEE